MKVDLTQTECVVILKALAALDREYEASEDMPPHGGEVIAPRFIREKVKDALAIMAGA